LAKECGAEEADFPEGIGVEKGEEFGRGVDVPFPIK
jgi:hypothetical protein